MKAVKEVTTEANNIIDETNHVAKSMFLHAHVLKFKDEEEGSKARQLSQSSRRKEQGLDLFVGEEGGNESWILEKSSEP